MDQDPRPIDLPPPPSQASNEILQPSIVSSCPATIAQHQPKYFSSDFTNNFKILAFPTTAEFRPFQQIENFTFVREIERISTSYA